MSCIPAPPHTISTHTPLAGRDAVFCNVVALFNYFYSHAPCGARQHHQYQQEQAPISTHTPLAGRDLLVTTDTGESFISTHTPLAGRDTCDFPISPPSITFLLTRPLRGATGMARKIPCKVRHFYSHAPCGARRKRTRVPRGND